MSYFCRVVSQEVKVNWVDPELPGRANGPPIVFARHRQNSTGSLKIDDNKWSGKPGSFDVGEGVKEMSGQRGTHMFS